MLNPVEPKTEASCICGWCRLLYGKMKESLARTGCCSESAVLYPHCISQSVQLHCAKLTWNLNRGSLKRMVVYKGPFFSFRVSLTDCKQSDARWIAVESSREPRWWGQKPTTETHKRQACTSRKEMNPCRNLQKAPN